MRRFRSAVNLRAIAPATAIFCLLLALLIFTEGCSSGNSGSSDATTPPPPSPTSNPLTVSPTSLTFTTSVAQTFSVSGGAGAVTGTNNCSGVATLSGPSGGVQTGTWTATPQANGTCSVTFSDIMHSVTLAITVNIPVSNPLTVNPTSLTFTTSSAQTFRVSGGAGAVTGTNNCSGVATLSGPSGGVQTGTWTATPQANGTCSATFSDIMHSVTLAITVNVTTTTTGNSTLNWPVVLSCPYTTYVKFFDETDNLVWPAPPQVFVLDHLQTYSNPLSCKTGAKICYGASLNQTNDSYYWGLGIDGTKSCTNCCYTCADTTVQPTTLACPGH